jgi:hypothetical protein
MGNGTGAYRDVPLLISVPFVAVGRGDDMGEVIVAVVD